VNRKQIAGLIPIGAGVALIIFSVHSMQKIQEAKGIITNTKNFFTHNPMWNPIITFFGGAAQKKISENDVPVMLCLFGGILLVILGLLVTVLCKSKNPRKKN